MSQPKFDNLADVTSKFVGTVCYYKDKPVFVKTAFHSDDGENKLLLSVAEYNKPGEIIEVNSPDFRYINYNLGYVNYGQGAAWWYRRPARQYQQGLKQDQLRFYSEDIFGKAKDTFQFNKRWVDMLSNKYPSFELCQKSTRDGMGLVAWHRDFAVLYNGMNDNMDDKYTLYYRASPIGSLLNSGKVILSPESNYLQEALQEAMGQ